MLGFFLLVLLPTLQVVLGGSKFDFTISQIVQCEPFTVNFSKDATDINISMTLTILPLNSSPVVIPIPSLALNSSGLSISFLPLQAGQDFIASLDDPAGYSLAHASDLTRVLASPTGNNSCLPPDGSFKDHFSLVSTPNQCEEITVSYDTEFSQSAPTVRAYSPKHNSYLLPRTSDNPSNGTATYIMNVEHGDQVLLAFDDGMKHRETSGLITVGGDASSPVDCLSQFPASSSTATAAVTSKTDDANTPTLIPREVIIGCSVGGGVIFIIIIAMVIFVIRDRKRRKKPRRRTINSFYTQHLVQNIPSHKEDTAGNPFEELPMFENGDNGNPSAGYICNPPYVMGELNSPNDGKHPSERASFSSWAHQESAAEVDTSSSHRRPSVDPLAIQTLDIEGMLNMATELSGTQAVGQADVGSDLDPNRTPRGGGVQPLPLEVPGVGPTRIRHWHAPSDVPADMTGSGTLSAYSMLMSNPFNDNGTILLPSPFNRVDEPTRSASDLTHPSPKDQIGGGDTSNAGGKEGMELGKGTRSSETESREET